MGPFPTVTVATTQFTQAVVSPDPAGGGVPANWGDPYVATTAAVVRTDRTTKRAALEIGLYFVQVFPAAARMLSSRRQDCVDCAPRRHRYGAHDKEREPSGHAHDYPPASITAATLATTARVTTMPTMIQTLMPPSTTGA